MADRTIEIDTGLDIEPVKHSLKELEQMLKRAKANVEKLREKYKELKEEQDDAYARADEAKARAIDEIRQKYNTIPKELWNKSYEQNMNAEIEQATSGIDKEFKLDKYETALEKIKKSLQDALDKQTLIQGEIGKTVDETSKWQEAMKGAESAVAYVQKRIKQLVRNVLFFAVISKVLRGIKDAFSGVLAENEQMATAVGQLKEAFTALITPIANALVPVLVTVLNFITRIVQALSMLIGKLFPKATKATKAFGKSAGSASTQLAGFDTIMKLGSSGGGGGGDEAETFALAQLTNEELGKTLMLLGAIATAFLAWKIPEGVTGFIGKAGGWLLLIAGLAMTIYGVFDMWENGLDLSNLAITLLGIFTTTMMLGELLSPVAQGIFLIVSGITLLITGFKDAIDNGSSLANTLAIIGGIIATGLGIFMLNKNIKTLITTGVLALLYAIVLLAGEGETFLNSLKQAFANLKLFVEKVFAGDIKGALTALKDFFSNILDAMATVVYSIIKSAWNGVAWLLNQAIWGINALIDKFNNGALATLVRNVTGWGYIPHIASVPYLAQGAVIPPNREFMAVLGDQKSGVNIETPLDTMIEAFKQAQGDQSINITFNGDLASLASILSPQITLQNKRRGL